MKKNLWLISFLLFLGIFCWKILLRGYVVGPFDFLMGFYHPYLDIKWSSPVLADAALHYKNYLMSDVVTVILPFKLLALNLVKSGIMPLWNPYILGGSPLFANVQSALLYPINIIYFLFNRATAFNIYIISQLLLAFVFMRLFLRSLKLGQYASYFGALAFSFSSFFIGWLPWGTLGHAFLWLPLVMWAVTKFYETPTRKHLLIGVAGLTFSFLAGHTQTALIVVLISISYVVIKYLQTRNAHACKVLLCMFGVAALLVGIQLLPTAEMYLQSVRDAVSTDNFYKDQTLLLSSYAAALAPDFFGNPVTRNWWGKTNYAESAVYFGAIAFYFILLSLLVRKHLDKTLLRFFAGLTLAGIVLSTQNPISYLVFKLHIPVLSTSAFTRNSMIYVFGGTVLASLVFDTFFKKIKTIPLKNLLIFNGMLFILVITWWVMIIFNLLPTTYVSNLDVVQRNSILPSLILCIALGITYLTRSASQRFKKHAPLIVNGSTLLVILILSFELLRFATKYVPFSPPEFFYPTHPLIEQLETATQKDRYIGYLPSNANALYGIRGIEGNDPLYNQHLAQVAILGTGPDAQISDRASMQIPDGAYKPRVLDLLSVRYFSDKTDNFRNSWIGGDEQRRLAFDDRYKETWKDTEGIYKLYESKYVVPRHRVFYKARVLQDVPTVQKTLISPEFNPLEEVVVDRSVQVSGTAGTNDIQVVKDDILAQKYVVTTSAPALFTVSDTHYPGWKASVNGKDADILRVNNTWRGVETASGKSTIEFSYKPASVNRGLLVTIMGIIALCLLLVVV